MNSNQRECLINTLNKTNKEIDSKVTHYNNNLSINNKDDVIREWVTIELTLLNNQKIMIEKALINDALEEL